MLTKELVICRSVGGRLYPKHVDTEDAELLQLAEQLLEAFQGSEAPVRSEIDEITEPLLNGAPQLTVAKGLLKIIEDGAEFTGPQDIDYPAERKRLMLASAELLKSGMCEDEEEFMAALRERAGESPLLQGENYYADLPDNDRLTKLDWVNARQVLEQYNIAQVQGLLIHASRLEVEVAKEEPSRLRRVFKYLKFFRLLAQATRSGDGGLKLVIDGPASILKNAKSYGMQLAVFFPAICSLKHWTLHADVEWRERIQSLDMDDRSRLVCPYHHFAAYVPEEVKLFERHFKDTAEGWTILEETPFLTGDAHELYFPDFSFRHEDGRMAHLELFHRWHSGTLVKRLDYVESHKMEEQLIIGVDRSLLNHGELSERLAASEWFQKYGFLFSDYPSVEKTVKCLNAID